MLTMTTRPAKYADSSASRATPASGSSATIPSASARPCRTSSVERLTIATLAAWLALLAGLIFGRRFA
jgi:hypothetical protein